MKLNQDCVRDVLIFLEENLTYNDSFPATDINISAYSMEEILYTVSLLYEAHYLKAIPINSFEFNSFFIVSLTMSGHELLDNIRDDTVWNKVKHKISSITSSVSLTILNSVASSVITDLLLK